MLIFSMLDNLEIHEIVNIVALLIGISFGAIAQKTQFCFNGAIKDYILLSSTRRAASVVFAIIVAIIATRFSVLVFGLDLEDTIWLSKDINYITIIIGGALFGTGMMIADGCSSRHLIKFAQGDGRSLVTLLFIAIFAYAAKYGILNAIVYSLISNETLLNISLLVENTDINIYIALFILSIILIWLTKSFKRILCLRDGLSVGLLIAFGWYITGIYGATTLELDTRYVSQTSLTFVGPLSNTLEFFTHYITKSLDFGISIILGVILGAFIMSRFNTKYSFGCTSAIKTNTLLNSIFGGSLMGVGGVMALGCTVGQGLTGVSTLAIGSFVAIVSIFVSAYITGRYLGKKNQLPMCFVFDWPDEKHCR